MTAVTSRVGAVSLAASPTGTGADAAGEAVLVNPSPACTHWLPAMVPHTHEDRFERDACEAEHLAQMTRLLRLAVA